MATIKAYTDIEQSKKLAEILPLESADMCYIKHSSSYNPNWEFNEDFPPMILGNVPINEITAETLPCWSLVALLSVIPNYKLSSEHNYHTCTAETPFGKEEVAWFDNPIDACVTMIEKLNKLKML